MIVAIGCDHAGVKMKDAIVSELDKLSLSCEDVGTKGEESVDYPDFGAKAAEMVSSGKAQKGILVCGTGIGMSIVANKFPGIRAALCYDEESAKMSRLHNDANMLILPGRVIDNEKAFKIINVWLETKFEGGRHQKRLDKITAIEERLCR